MKISYSRTETINLGNFENIKLEIKAEDDLQNNESNAECIARLKNFVHQSLSDELKNTKRKFSTTEILTGEKLAQKMQEFIKNCDDIKLHNEITTMLLNHNLKQVNQEEFKKLSDEEAMSIYALAQNIKNTFKKR